MTDPWKDLKDDPLDPVELQRARLALQRSEDSWPVIGPMVALLTNWKAWAGALALAAWFNRPEIAAALQIIFGGRP